MLNLSRKDRMMLPVLVAEGVLRAVDWWKIRQNKGVIIVPCADGNHFFGIVAKLAFWAVLRWCWPKIHPLTEHGGAARLSQCSRLGYRQDRVDDVIEAATLMGTKTIVLMVHSPCGKAGLCGATLEDLFDDLCEAEKIIKERIEGADVVCLFHMTMFPLTRIGEWLVRRGIYRKRVAYFCTKGYQEWRNNFGRENNPHRQPSEPTCGHEEVAVTM